MVMEEVIIHPDSEFIGHVYLQHSGADEWGKYCPRYQMYTIREEVDLKEAIAFRTATVWVVLQTLTGM